MVGDLWVGVRTSRGATLGLGLLACIAAQTASAADCPGHPDALGTSRTLVVDPREHPRIGSMQYAETLPLGDHEVVLTFDDGPLPHNSNQVLDILASQCVKATFFIIGSLAKEYPDWVQREARAGHDGTWIAHPGLADIARAAFDAVMPGPNQLGVLRAEVNVTPQDLLTVPEGEITEAGLRGCIRVGVQYLESWLRGNGCVPLYHLMEDAATAEICRAQLWQWLRHGARTSDGQPVTVERFDRLLSAELDRIHEEVGAARLTHGVFPTAARLFEQMTKRETFDEFLTLPAYELLS